jgi:PTS system galactitol-specific IIA component
MQFQLKDLLSPSLVITGLAAETDEDVIHALTGLLVQAGRAEIQFNDAVLKREKVFPTGLPTQPVGVAIPHADPDGVHESGICVGILSKAVPFGMMGTDGSTKVDASIVFLLAIREREKQTVMIQELITLIQSPGLLAALSKSNSVEEVCKLICSSTDPAGMQQEG